MGEPSSRRRSECNLLAKPNLTSNQMNMLGQLLIEGLVDGKLPRCYIAVDATKFGVTRRTVFKYWNKVTHQRIEGKPVNLCSKKIGAKRRKRIKLDEEKMKSIELIKRGTIRNLDQALGKSKSTIGRWKKKGVIRAHTSAISPGLSYENQIARLKYCLEAICFQAEENKVEFKPMEHIIHLDEKWFYITRTAERYYMCLGEENPHRTCQSKRFITKVMFLCDVSRPIYDNNGNLSFDGKIGMWPFITREPAKRNNKNRVAGVIVTKPLDSVNTAITKNMLINQVLLAIKAKWPVTSSKDISIQWDNAPPHINNDDVDFRAAASSDGFNMQLKFQPANSPDTSINDLGWFNSLDSVRRTLQANNVDELINGVQEAFEKLSAYTLNKLFLSLQSCMRGIMDVRGSNNYPLEHLGKDHLDRNGQLQRNLTMDT